VQLALVVAVALVGGAVHETPSVVVPVHAQQTNVLEAWNELHAAGLRVELTRPIAIDALRVPIAARVIPRPGTRVPRRSVVRITPRPGLIGSPAVLESHPRYRVPSFVGRPASDAVAWADRHRMFWDIPRVTPLSPSSAPHLLDAYRVVAQRPRPGGVIAQGVMIGHGFRPTPLTLTVVPR
jgi:hypothetical protein